MCQTALQFCFDLVGDVTAVGWYGGWPGRFRVGFWFDIHTGFFHGAHIGIVRQGASNGKL